MTTLADKIAEMSLDEFIALDAIHDGVVMEGYKPEPETPEDRRRRMEEYRASRVVIMRSPSHLYHRSVVDTWQRALDRYRATA